MRLALPRLRRSTWAALAVLALLLLALAAHQHLARMDGRFFVFLRLGPAPGDPGASGEDAPVPRAAIRVSWPGLKGLVLYLVGDYAGAARAYRAHYREHAVFGDVPDAAEEPLLRGDFGTARRLAEAALAGRSDDRSALLTLGYLAMEEGRGEEAQGFFRRVLERHPDQFDALLLSSVVHARAGRYGSAIDALNRALRHWRIEERITSFLAALEVTGALERLPAARRPWCLLAHYHRYLRIFDNSHAGRAVADARRAIEVGDRPADAHLTISLVYGSRGKPEAALEEALEAVQAGPRHGPALLVAAVAYAGVGDLAGEYRMLKAAVEVEPGDPVYLNRLNRFLIDKVGDYPQALEVTSRALAVNPRNAEALGQLGAIHLSLGDPRAAVESYRRAVALAPGDPLHSEGLGMALTELGRLDEALEVLRGGIALAPAHPGLHSRLGLVYDRLRRYRAAAAEYEMALRLGEADPTPHQNLCWTYRRLNDSDRALRCFRELARRDPTNVRVRHQLTIEERNLALGGRP